MVQIVSSPIVISSKVFRLMLFVWNSHIQIFGTCGIFIFQKVINVFFRVTCQYIFTWNSQTLKYVSCTVSIFNTDKNQKGLTV